MQNNDYLAPIETDAETIRQIDENIKSMAEFQRKALYDIIKIFIIPKQNKQ